MGLFLYYKSSDGINVSKNFIPYEADNEYLTILNTQEIINKYSDIITPINMDLYDYTLDIKSSGIYLPYSESNKYWNVDIDIQFTPIVDDDSDFYSEAIICLKTDNSTVCENITVSFNKINIIRLREILKIDKSTLLKFDLILIRLKNRNINFDININKVKWQVRNLK